MITAQPSSSFEAPFGAGVTGLVGTIALGIIDNQGAITQALTTTGIIETPAGSGIYAATRTAPATAGQYTLIWSLDGSTDPDQVYPDDLVVTSQAAFVGGFSGDAYATVDELARILKLRAPTTEQEAAMERVLITAAGEINSEIDLADDADALAGWQLALAAEVNLERAVEHWQQSESPFGIIGLGDGSAIYTARDSWNRHALKLAPLKSQFGLA